MADGLTYGQEQAEKNLEYWQGLSGQMRKPSDLASPEEKAAYTAQQVRAGAAPAEMLSEDYGGRPQGSSRRAIRMAAAWDAEQTARIQQEQAMRQQQADMEQATREERRLSIAEQAERRQQWAQDTKEQRDAAILEQSGKIQSEIIGATLSDGKRLRPININDDDAVERLQSTIYSNRLGMEDQATKEVVTKMLDDAMRVRQQKLETEISTKGAINKEKVALAKDLGVYGMSIADFTKDGVVNFEAANAAIGKAWAEGKEVSEEQAQTEEQRKAVSSKITDAEKELLKVRARTAAALKRVEARPTVKDFQTELEAAQIEQGILEDEVNRLNRMLGAGEQTQAPARVETEQSQQPESEKTNIQLPQGWETMDLDNKMSFISDVFGTKDVNGSGPENDPSGLLNVNVGVDKSGEKSAIEKAAQLGYSQKESTLSGEGYKFIKFTLDKNGRPSEEFYIRVDLPEKDKAAAIWAGQNWNDPRSKKIRAKLGVE